MNPFQYRSDIDGLRAVAILLVIAGHYVPDLLASGYLGVDIFFAISGYVVTGSLLGNASGTILAQLTGFYRRRIKRIVPALLMMIVLTAMVAAWVSGPTLYEGVADAAIFALFGVGNYYFLLSDSDYFSNDVSDNPFVHTWSLGVEEQFYFVFPFFILLSAWSARKSSIRGHVILFFMIASIAYSFYVRQDDPLSAFYTMPCRFWELGGGAYLCLLRHQYPEWFAGRSTGVARLRPLAAIVMIVGGLMLASYDKNNLLLPQLLVVAGSLIVFACREESSWLNQWIAFAPIVWIGKRSYSLYLWHWPVYRMAVSFFPQREATVLAGAFGVVVVLALLSYRVERAFIDWRPGHERSVLLLFPSGALLVGLLIAGALKPFNHSIWGGGSRSLPTPWWQNPCHLTSFASGDVQRCLNPLGAQRKGKKVLLIGDSHAANYYTAFRKLEEAFSYSLHLMSIGLKYHGCTIMPEPFIARFDERSARTLRAARMCTQYNQAILDFLASDAIAEGDVVVVGIYHLYTLAEQNGIPRQAMIDLLNRMAALLHERKALLVMMSDVPLLARHPSACVRPGWRAPQFIPRQCGVDEPLFQYGVAALHDIYKSVANTNFNAFFIDVHDFFCKDGYCDAFKDGKLLFADINHISVEANLMLAPAIAARFAEIMEMAKPSSSP
ncbi:MAG: acyltransferase [Magnetococcales bacterium]|nr:acyltransferase [Magnetococcales bacterium]